jgi:formylglycine-generating enzyme required for sulfatase activity
VAVGVEAAVSSFSVRAAVLAACFGSGFIATGARGEIQPIVTELPGGASLAMVWVEPGDFRMGDLDEFDGFDRFDEDDGFDEFDEFDEDHIEQDPRTPDQLPEHPVVITEGFWLGRFEVTQAQWESVMGTRPWEGQPSTDSDPNRPAAFISWNDAQSLVVRLNQAAGDSLYRLPSEAEWEYACRADTESWWSFGTQSSKLADHGWYERNGWEMGERIGLPVGAKLPNPWGLFDMHGNVREWVQDWYGEDYYEDAPERDPRGPVLGSSRVLRGGDFASTAEFVRSSWRFSARPGAASIFFGVRLLARRDPSTLIQSMNWGQAKTRRQGDRR